MNPDLVRIFLKDSNLETMLEANNDSIAEYVMGCRSYETSQFSTLIDDSSPWSAIIASHIHIDHILDVFLKEFCVRPEAINPEKRRMSALDKSSFLFGVGVLSKGSLSSVKYVNSIRNKFAHKLKFDVSDKETSEYRSAFLSFYPERLKSRDEYAAAQNGEVDLKTLLKLSVLFIEEERLAYLMNALRGARSQADLEDALSLAQRSLSNPVI